MRRTHAAAAVWAATALVLGAACDVQRVESQIPAQHLDGADGGPSVGPDGGAASDRLTDPTGTWALLLEDRHCLTALGQSIENLIWTWYVVHLEDRGPGAPGGPRYVTERLDTCTQELTPVIGGLLTVIPLAVPESVPELSVDAFLHGPEPGDAYVAGEMLEVWGVRGVGAEEALPTDPLDPRVFDEDGDGAPGVTVVLGDDFCHVQIVQRTRTRRTGTVIDGNRVVGSLSSVLEKIILDADSPLCRTPNDLGPSPVESRFHLVRVDGRGGSLDMDTDEDGDVGCNELLAGRQALIDGGLVEIGTPEEGACR